MQYDPCLQQAIDYYFYSDIYVAVALIFVQVILVYLFWVMSFIAIL